ncbi:hypothetical protein KR009_011652 [Drosophila setifemur]|nr:hypothetical protein KR009_011652 [Drosophila setifemur]
MDPQREKDCRTQTFTISQEATTQIAIVTTEVSISSLDLRNYCRLCLEEPHPHQMLDMTITYDQEADLSYYDCYEICTKEDLRQSASHEPRALCKHCAVELQWAYDFHKKVALANQQLREILEAINVQNYQPEEPGDELVDMGNEEFILELVEEEEVKQDFQEENETESVKSNEFPSLEDIVPRKRFSGQFSCQFCKKVFKNRSRMTKHEAIHLANRPVFQCSQCNCVYLTKQALKVHVDSKHNESGISCDICGKVFAIAKAMEIHKRYHTGDFPFACDLCPRKFAQRSHLTIHHRVQHAGARFICEFPGCQKSFTSSSSLRNHECTHTAMPFECSHCQQSFPARNKLRLHLERKHNKQVGMEELEGMRKFKVLRSKLMLAKKNEEEKPETATKED